MIKFTKGQLRQMVAEGYAQDITKINFSEANELRTSEGWMEQIGYASGTYGCSGMFLKGHSTGTLYAVTNRTQAIFLF